MARWMAVLVFNTPTRSPSSHLLTSCPSLVVWLPRPLSCIRRSHRKWRETKQQLSWLPDLTLVGCHFVSLHFRCNILMLNGVGKECEGKMYKSNQHEARMCSEPGSRECFATKAGTTKQIMPCLKCQIWERFWRFSRLCGLTVSHEKFSETSTFLA